MRFSLEVSSEKQTVRLPAAFIQPILSDDVVAVLSDITLGEPANGTVDLAGPDRFRFDELMRQFLSANHDTREIVTDSQAHYFGAKLDDQSLVPLGNSHLGSTRFEDWLSHPPI